ncbi:hypothetical protein [Natrinema ejinorense]|uniref:hypothetical protein n=1 Tax=Natrinema ejinorense TaxID=373386 RepID=UPI00117EA193|nr:hypothetical protein [Natrinema ejinorense]
MTWERVDGRDVDKIEAAFATFLNNLSRETESDGAASAKFEADFVDSKTISVETFEGEAVRLGPVPYEPGDRSVTVEVYIQFGLTVRKRRADEGPEYLITKSSTEMVYLQVTEDDGSESRERVQGLHFDFDLHAEQANGENGDHDANHPVFHAQYNPNCIDTVAFEHWEPPAHEQTYPDYPRIPCAPFDVVAVGYMVLNDHLPEQVIANQGWPSDEFLADNLPQFPEEAFNSPMPGRLHSEAWYVHHCTPTDGRPLVDPNNHRRV